MYYQSTLEDSGDICEPCRYTEEGELESSISPCSISIGSEDLPDDFLDTLGPTFSALEEICQKWSPSLSYCQKAVTVVLQRLLAFFRNSRKKKKKKDILKALQCLQHEHLAFHSSCLHCFTWAAKILACLKGSLCRGDGGNFGMFVHTDTNRRSEIKHPQFSMQREKTPRSTRPEIPGRVPCGNKSDLKRECSDLLDQCIVLSPVRGLFKSRIKFTTVPYFISFIHDNETWKRKFTSPLGSPTWDSSGPSLL